MGAGRGLLAMKSQGSIYVSVVLGALAGYFIYQWWFNPNRIIKQRLGEVASALSTPATEEELARIARLGRLRRYLDDRVHVRIGRAGPEFHSRDDVIGAAAGWKTASGGRNVDFVDVDVRVSSDGTARAFVTGELTTRDPQTGQETLESREVMFSLLRKDGDWLISEAEVKDSPRTQ
jgi:hypothetical protein